MSYLLWGLAWKCIIIFNKHLYLNKIWVLKNKFIIVLECVYVHIYLLFIKFLLSIIKKQIFNIKIFNIIYVFCLVFISRMLNKRKFKQCLDHINGFCLSNTVRADLGVVIIGVTTRPKINKIFHECIFYYFL